MVDQAYIAQLEKDFARIDHERTPGYGDGAQHEVLKNTHDAINGNYSASPSTSLKDVTADVSRQALLLKLSMDSANKLTDTSALQEKMATDIESMARSNANRAIASQSVADPLRASAVALVETVAPSENVPEKMGLEFYQYQLMTVSKRSEGLTKLGQVGDLLGSMVPGRILLSTARAGKAVDGSSVGYFNALRNWQSMTIPQRSTVWDTTEQQVWDASGHNVGIYSSLINPFLDPSDELNHKVALALDVWSVESVAELGWALATRVGGRQGVTKMTQEAAMRFRARAKAMGNEPLAGRVAVSDIKNGDITPLVEASPTPPPAPLSLSLTKGDMTVPTTLGMIEDMKASGKLLPGQPMAVVHNPLAKDIVDAFVERNKLKILSGGKAEIKGTTVDYDNLVVEFDASYPSLRKTPVADVRAAEIARGKTLKDLRTKLKLIVKDTPDPGALAANEEAQRLTNEINSLSGASKEARAALRYVRKLEGSGLKAAEVAVTAETPAKVRLHLTVDEAGQFQFKDSSISTLSHIIGSQESRVGNVERGLASLGQFIRQQQRGLFGKLSGQVTTIQKSLRTGPIYRLFGKDEGVSVDALVNTGDRLGKVFTENELRSGIEVDGIGHVTFNQRQIDAYHALRDLYDDYWLLADQMQARQLRFDGNSQFHVRLYDGEGKPKGVVPTFGRAREDDLQYSIPTVGKNKIVHAIDARSGDVVDLSTIGTLESDLNKGKKAFVKLQKTIIQGNGDHFDYILVNVDNIGELKVAREAREITTTLEYHPGYSPRITHEPVNFIIERPTELRKNGVVVQTTAIDRAFGSKMEAEIYRDKLIAKRHAKAATAGLDPNAVKTDDILLTAVNDDWRRNPANKEKVDFIDGHLFSGAFVGNRHPNGRLKIGLDGHEAQRISSFEAARRYADFLGSYYPTSEYKSAMIKKFLASARNEDGTSMLQIASDWTSPIVSKSSGKYKEVEALQNWMKTTFAVPKTEESSMMGFANQIGMSLDKFIWDRVAGTKRPVLGTMFQAPQRALLGRKWSTNPVTMLKSATFDLMLGMFNPVQFFIQSSGMFIPFHLHPLTGTKIMPQFLALRTLASGDVEAVGGIARSMGMNGEEFKTLWHAWHRSGVPDSILENADFGHYLGTQGAYYSPDMLRSIRDKSRIFYNQGELNNRMYSFVMAFNRMADKQGWDLTKRLTDGQIQEINQEALRLGINFGAGNRARWQEGILSIPTQFWQVGHKYVENFMNGALDNALGKKLGVRGKENSWSKQETMTALLGNMMIWGYASVGLDELFPSLDAWLTDPKGLGLDPKKDRILLAGMRGGFLEMMSLRALGIWPDVSDRTAPAAQMADIWKNTVVPMVDWMVGDGTASDIARVAGGASASMGTKVGRAISDILLTLDTAWLAGDLTQEDIFTIFSDIGGLASTFSNAQKFRVWREAGKRLDSQLRDLGVDSDNTPMDPRVAWLRLLGLDSIEVEMQRNLTNRQRDRKTEQKATQDALMVEFRKILTYDGTKGDALAAREANRRIKVIMQTLPRSEQKYIWNKAMSELDGPFAGNKFYEKLLEEFYNADPGSPIEQQLSQELRLYQLAQGQSNAE